MTNSKPNGIHYVDDDAERHQIEFDPLEETVSEVLVQSICSIEETTPEALPVLAESVDPDVLDDLFTPRADGPIRSAERAFYFWFAGYEIWVHSGGIITISSNPHALPE